MTSVAVGHIILTRTQPVEIALTTPLTRSRTLYPLSYIAWRKRNKQFCLTLFSNRTLSVTPSPLADYDGLYLSYRTFQTFTHIPKIRCHDLTLTLKKE